VVLIHSYKIPLSIQASELFSQLFFGQGNAPVAIPCQPAWRMVNANVLYHSRKLRSQPRSANFDIVACKYGRRTEAVSANLRNRNVKVFIPIYPNTLPTVPKRSRASRTLSSVIINLGRSRSATTRLENR